MTLIKGTWEH